MRKSNRCSLQCGLFYGLALLLLSAIPAFALPQKPPVSNPAAAPQTITIPFELINQHIYLTVMINGKGPYHFFLDTGAYDVLTPELAQSLGLLKTDKKASNPQVNRVQIDSLGIGPLHLKQQSFAVLPFPDYKDIEGVPDFGGLIGYELFKQYVIRIDYVKHLLALTPPDQFHYSGDGVTLPLTFYYHIPQFSAQVDGISGLFDLDTGDRRSLDIFPPFAKTNHLTLPSSATVVMTGWGMNGPVWSQMGRVKSLQIGGLTVTSPVTEWDLSKGGAFVFPGTAGNIGGSLLMQFNLIIDYSRRQVTFEKNANFGQPINDDKSGLWLMKDKDAWIVKDVAAGSPGADVGLQTDDHIVAIDGALTSHLSLSAVRARLRDSASGTQIHMTVRSGTATQEKILTLRELATSVPSGKEQPWTDAAL